MGGFLITIVCVCARVHARVCVRVITKDSILAYILRRVNLEINGFGSIYLVVLN